MAYQRVTSSSPFSDGSATDATVLINAHSSGIEALQAKFTGAFLPESYGAAAATVGSTGNMSSGSAVFTDSSASFTSGDVGKTMIVGATNYSSALVTTIASYQSATQVTLTANAPSAQSNVSYVYGVDCTSAFTSLATAATAGSAVFLAGLYIITGTGPVFNRVKMFGNGFGDMSELATGMSGIISTSPTAVALTENAAGSVFTDFAVLNMSATTPSSSVGIKVQYGSYGRKRNLYVSGFYNNIDYTTTSGRYWVIADSRIMDPVNYGLYLHNTTPSSDECDAAVYGSQFVNIGGGRNPVAAVRWESGGGIRFQNNKINQGYNGSRFQYGFQALVADNVATGVMLIANNSIENCSAYGINFGTLTANAASQSLTKISIQGNEIGVGGSTGGGIYINPQVKWLYTDTLIMGNIIRDLGTGTSSNTVSGTSGSSSITFNGWSGSITVGMYVTGTGLSVATTGTALSGSTALTVASGTNIAVGHYVVGSGIASGTTVTAVSGTSVTLSQNTTGALSVTAVTFAPQITAVNGQTATLSVPTFSAVSGTGSFVGTGRSECIRLKNLDAVKAFNNSMRASYHVYIESGCSSYDLANNSAGAGGVMLLNSDKDNGSAPASYRPLTGSRPISTLTAGQVANQFSIDFFQMTSSILVEITITGRLVGGSGATGACGRTKRYFITPSSSGVPVISTSVFDIASGTSTTLDMKTSISGTVVYFQPYHNETGATFRGNQVITVTGPVYSFAETGSTI
jgi:hypothetical protein